MGPFDLTGKVALVTGGSAGIGQAIARGLAGAGAKVVIAARDEARGLAAVAELPGAVFEPVDVADPESRGALVANAARHFGGLDILVNNAGFNIAGPAEGVSLEDWRAVLEVNLTAPFVLAQAAHAEFARRGGGKVINVGSLATLFGSGQAAAYGASKGAIGQLTKGLATAWAKDNIQVNAILPGYIETELMTRTLKDRPGYIDRIIARTPAGRLGRPTDCAGAAVFLASPASDFVTGVLIPVDGGYSSQL